MSAGPAAGPTTSRPPPRASRRALAMTLLGLATLGALVLLPLEPPPRAPNAWLARAGVAARFVDAGGYRLRYVRRGAGPPVILIHGLGSSSYTWAEVLPALAERHDVVAFDLPGFGASQLGPGATGADYVALVPALMDRLGIARASLVGSSLGGAVAAALAAGQPSRVDRLVLIDAAGFDLTPQHRPALLRLLEYVPTALAERLPRKPFVALALRQVFHDPARITPERLAEYVAAASRPGAVRALQGLLRSRETLGLPERLGEVRAPTLVLWGRQDRWIPVADADRFVAAIPGARKVVLDACGHLPQEERPEEAARLIEGFLLERSAGAPRD